MTPLDPQYPDLLFPLAGLDLSREFGQQSPNTTPTATNVRGYEALTLRQRGGSRSGLRKYLPTQVNGTHLIQHLAVIVDPTPRGLPAFGTPYTPGTGLDPDGGGVPPTATGTGFTPADPGTTTDPSTNNNAGDLGVRNPGRIVRTGGTGDQPNRNIPSPPKAKDDSLSTFVGDGSHSVDVLANDFYVGTPGIVILSGPFLTSPAPLPGATAVVTGLGTGSRIVYTPPPGGTGGMDIVTYRLTDGSGNHSDARLVVTVDPNSTPDPGPGNRRQTKRTYVLNSPYDILEFQYPTNGLQTCLGNIDGTTYQIGPLGFNFNAATWPTGTLPTAAALNQLAALLDGTTYTFGPPLSDGSDHDIGPC